ncbi:MAG TPA: HIT family protein [Candidatus Binatia bacterium]|jgi:diadenosine tetraphosphate (Ap4A) HIT family hydrolase|nr:HIT family protein [Candidatus Binatia bacterium]
MSCPACERIARIAQDKEPDFVMTLAESHVTLADEQAYPGYCILILKDHQEHLDELPLDRQARLWDDVARVATGLRREFAPLRLNYACLGNFLTHVHWHVIPRYETDPEPQHPIWVRPLAERRAPLTAAQRHELIARLRRALR